MPPWPVRRWSRQVWLPVWVGLDVRAVDWRCRPRLDEVVPPEFGAAAGVAHVAAIAALGGVGGLVAAGAGAGWR